MAIGRGRQTAAVSPARHAFLTLSPRARCGRAPGRRGGRRAASGRAYPLGGVAYAETAVWAAAEEADGAHGTAAHGTLAARPPAPREGLLRGTDGRADRPPARDGARP